MLNWNDWLSDTAQHMRASDIRELLKIVARPEIISFAGGLPDPQLFPLEAYREAADYALNHYGSKVLQYSAAEGITELRERLVELLAKENISCPDGKDNIVITTGSQQALELLGAALLNPGDTLLVEAPSYTGALQAFSLRRPAFEAVEIDEQGLQVDKLALKIAELKKSGRRPRVLYTIPTFQNPAGTCMSLERRHALLKLAETEDLVIIEDDPYGKLRFSGEALPSLKSLDSAGRVVSLRTFSKTLAPAMRTGYVIGAAPIIAKLVILKQAADLCSPAFNQYLILRLIENGVMDSYIQTVAKKYGAKANRMLEVLNTEIARYGAQWNTPEGGMFIWLTLPDGLDSAVLLQEALEGGVAFVKGAAFYPENYAHLGKSHFRLNFSHPSLEQIESGITRLGKVLEKQLGLVAVRS